MTSADRDYLGHILDAARRARQFVSGMTHDEFLADVKTQYAVLYCLSVIGEAAKWVSDETCKALSDLEWRKMKGMRNFVVHEYWATDLTITWETVQTNLPPLIATLERHLR